MKFCPICQTHYDEETLRFCTKDGTPLVEETIAAFTELPSETTTAENDFVDETVVSRRPSAQAKTETIEETKHLSAPPPRIVISTDEPPRKTFTPPQSQVVRARTTTVFQTEPHRRSNTGKIVALTLLGTFLILGSAALLYMMTRDKSGNAGNTNRTININADNFNSVPDTNLNTNLNFGNIPENFNANANFNTEANSIKIDNARTPTPTPTPTPTRTPMLNSNINISNPNPSPSATGSATPTPAPSPKPSVTTPPMPSATPTPKPSPSVVPTPPPAANRPVVNAGVLNGRAVSLPKPAYPPIARQMRAAGQVVVQVVVDETGNVTAARATSGNALLRPPAEAAARQSKIAPVKIGDRNVEAVGILLYNFINQ
ncbi:MAG: energy transducer TonB [Acidobacteria bacterium]|nr:energy transducer TonB [Acidobacteriota bacterium]